MALFRKRYLGDKEKHYKDLKQNLFSHQYENIKKMTNDERMKRLDILKGMVSLN